MLGAAVFLLLVYSADTAHFCYISFPLACLNPLNYLIKPLQSTAVPLLSGSNGQMMMFVNTRSLITKV